MFKVWLDAVLALCFLIISGLYFSGLFEPHWFGSGLMSVAIAWSCVNNAIMFWVLERDESKEV